MAPARRRIRAVVFDLDDTLYFERHYVRSGFSAVGEFLRQKLGGATGREPLEDWMWRRFLAGRRSNMFDALSRRFALGLGRRGVAELVEVYRGHRPAIRPCRGVEDLLAELRRSRLRLGLLTDGFLPAQRLKLRALALERHFHAVVFTERLGRDAWKPSPRGFELARTKLSVPHAACAYVADNPAKDFLAPNRLGWLTVQWRRRGQVHARNAPPAAGRPKRVVRSGPELLRLLRTI